MGRIVSGTREIAHIEFVDLAARAATGLASIGVGANDAVAILLRNEIAFLEASRAAALLGAFSVPINWHLNGPEVAYILGDSGAKVLVVHADLLTGIEAAIPDGITVLVVATPDEVAAAYGIADAQRKVQPDQIEWTTWIDTFEPALPSDLLPPAAIIYTSGTTGRSKGVRRTPSPTATLQSGGTMGASVMGLRPEARTLIAGPMYHSAPNIYAQAMAAVGAEVWLQPKFDAEDLLVRIERDGLTHLHLVPLMFVRLLKLPVETRRKYDVSSLRHVVHAAAPCPPDVKRQMIDWWGPIIAEYYGSTELGAVVFCTSEEWLAHLGTVGRPLPNTEVKIIGEDGAELRAGEVGEVYARNHAVPDFTYSGDPEKRREVERDGLISAGDVGYLDDDGYLYLCDRRRDMVISGGVNIYPAEIEAVLLGMTGVADCAVFGIPHEEFGEALAAVVQPQIGVTVDPSQISVFLRERLASFQVPRHIQLASELPREDSGKIFKRKLRDPFWAAAGRQI